MAKPGNAREENFGRAHARKVGYIGAGIVLFAIFLIAEFPYSDAASSVLAPAGLGLNSTAQHVRFPFGAELDDVRLVSLESPAAALLHSERVRLTPSLGSLFLLQQSFNAATVLYGGVLNVTAGRADERTLVGFDLQALKLAENHELSASGASLAGLLSGSGNLVLVSAGSDSGDFALRATGMKLTLNGQVSPIDFGDVSARLKLVGGALRLEELKSTGGDLVLDGKGTIRPFADWPQSPIDLTVKMRLSPEGQSRLQFLQAMLPYPPDDRPYHISGTVGAPVFLDPRPSPKRPSVETARRISPSAGAPLPDNLSREEKMRLLQERLSALGLRLPSLEHRDSPSAPHPPQPLALPFLPH